MRKTRQHYCFALWLALRIFAQARTVKIYCGMTVVKEESRNGERVMEGVEEGVEP